MTTKIKTNRDGKTADQRARELLAACKVEMQAIADELLGDYAAAIDSGRAGWDHVGALASVLRRLNEVQGKE